MSTNYRAEFSNALAALSKCEPHLPHGKALDRARTEHKALWLASCYESAVARVEEKRRMGTCFTNDSAAASSAVPTSPTARADAENVFLLHGCTPEEFAQAWSANHGRARPVDWNNIFGNMVRKYGQGQTPTGVPMNSPTLDAVRDIERRFPEFFARCTGVTLPAASTDATASAEMTNSASYSSADVHLSNHFLIPGCTGAQLEAAVKACGGVTAKPDHTRIMSALVAHEQREGRWAHTAAWNRVAQKFPALSSKFNRPTILRS